MTTRILITSDTHLARGARLPTALLELACSSDHVIHAGDATTMDVLDTLAALAPLTAVTGNVDDGAVAARLPVLTQIELEAVTIGVVHDPGPGAGRHERLARRLPACDVIVYGHTHMPEVHRSRQGTVFINPGSPTQRRRAPWHSACWLEVEDGTIRSCEVVNVDTIQ